MVLINKNRAILVRPWVKIELDVPFIESEWDGKSLLETDIYPTPLQRDRRLYFSMPQLFARTLPVGENEDEGKPIFLT